MDPRNQKIALRAVIVCSILLALALLVGLIVYLTSGNAVDQCTLQRLKPTLSEHIQKHASQNNLAMVEFDGYLQFSGDNNVTSYMPLQLNSIIHEQDDKYTIRIHLLTDCCRISLYMDKWDKSDEPQWEWYQVYYIRIELNTPRDGHHVCTNELAEDLSDLRTCDEHSYECTRSVGYDCRVLNEPVARLVVNHLRFEVDSTPKFIAHKLFGPTVMQCADSKPKGQDH